MSLIAADGCAVRIERELEVDFAKRRDMETFTVRSRLRLSLPQTRRRGGVASSGEMPKR